MSAEPPKPKIRLDTDTSNLDRERLELEKDKVDFQHQLERERFEFEKSSTGLEERRIKLEEAKAIRETRFLNKYFGTVITAIISLAAVLVSVAQVIGTISTRNKELAVVELQKNKELAMVEVQKKNELEFLKEKQGQEWNLSTAKFFTEHQKQIFSNKAQERDAIFRILIATFPPSVIDAISKRDAAIGKSIEHARSLTAEITTDDPGPPTIGPPAVVLTTPRTISKAIIRETYDTNVPRLLKHVKAYHYLVDTNGGVHKVFDTPDEFLQACSSCPQSKESIIIGMVHQTGENTYTQAQLQGLVTLLIKLRAKYGIPPEGILTSSEVRPFKNTDIKSVLGELRSKVKNGDTSALSILPKVREPEPIDSVVGQSRPDIEKTVNRLITEIFKVAENRVGPDTRFREDLRVGIDDSEMIDFKSGLEKAFGVEISFQEADGFKKVKDVYDYIEKHRRK